LKICNPGSHSFSFTSVTMGFGANMIVQAGETYMCTAPIYRDNAHMHDPLTVDMTATYWQATQ
jgi:hypothetical protein